VNLEDRSVFELIAPLPDVSGDDVDIYEGGDRGNVILIHGGYWRPEYDRTHLRPLASALALLGFRVISLEYRRIPGFPDLMVQDVLEGVKRYPDAILIGHSAGGHLALLVAQRIPSQIQKVIALAPVADLQKALDQNLDDGAAVQFLGEHHPNEFNPMTDGDLPMPVTLIHGVLDQRVPVDFSRAFSEKFGTRYIELPDIGHFELIDPRSRVFTILVDEINP
jgi:pimeloyl-ACP methyl ester carboxylesterase